MNVFPLPLQLPVFNTKVGNIRVTIQQENIVNASTECIANACNGKLLHDAGIALDISNNAGDEYDSECQDIINAQKRHRLPVACAIMTGAGQMPNVRRIVNVVGPNFTTSKDRSKNCKLLTKAYENMFDACEEEEIKSLTLPLLSSGEHYV